MGQTKNNLYTKRKHRVFEVIQIGNRNDLISCVMDIVIVANILINILCMFLSTFEQMRPYFGIIHVVEFITIGFFCIEYGLRLWTAEFLYPDRNISQARIRYLYSYDGIVDLLTILPFMYFSGFVVFRMLRVVRIFHLFRINNQYDSFHVITSVIYERKNQIISSVFIIVILMFASSLCMYSVEHEAQPEVFQNAFSGIWWSMSTLLTVGYGDIYPITTIGKAMAIVIAFLGVGAVAIPTGIISAGFVEQYAKMKNVEEAKLKEKIQFITVRITENHNYRDRLVKNLELPKGMTMPVLIRDGKVLFPNGDTRIEVNDELVFAGKNSVNIYGYQLLTAGIGSDHEWAHQKVRELDISRRTTLVSVNRDGVTILPHGDTVILPGDEVIYISQKKSKLS